MRRLPLFAEGCLWIAKEDLLVSVNTALSAASGQSIVQGQPFERCGCFEHGNVAGDGRHRKLQVGDAPREAIVNPGRAPSVSK